MIILTVSNNHHIPKEIENMFIFNFYHHNLIRLCMYGFMSIYSLKKSLKSLHFLQKI